MRLHIRKVDTSGFPGAYKLTYQIDVEDEPVGHIVLDNKGEVYFLTGQDTEVKIDFCSMTDIYEFAKKVFRVENDEELDTLQNEYFYK